MMSVSVLYLALACVCAMFLLVATCLVLFHVLKLPQLPSYKLASFMSRAKAGPIAHRGGRPENTLAAITKSSQLGAPGIEVDLAFTKDGEAVLLHDERVDRTCNGSGKVEKFTLKELKNLDFGVKTGGPGYTAERIPTLAEAIELCEQLDILMFLEIKAHADVPRALQLVKKLFSDKPALYSRIAVISFYPNIVYKLRRQDRNLVCGLVTRSSVLSTTTDGTARNRELWKHLLAKVMESILFFSIRTWLWKFLGLNLLIAHKDDILSESIHPRTWEKRGVSLVGWTVDTIQEKNHFKYLLKIPFMSDNVAVSMHRSSQGY